jgi:NADH dehydrogenase
MLGYIAENILSGLSKTAQWNQIAEYQEMGYQLLDVRGASEVARGAIPGFENLPVDEIRERKAELKNKEWKPFRYKDLGSMATVGKSMAVVDLPFVSFHGFFAWFVWLFVHLMAILGVKNKLMVFLTWSWKYLSFDPSLRLLIRPRYVKEFKRQWMLEEKDYED